MRRRSYPLCLSSLLPAGLLLMTAGCYKHVVETRGPGARNVDIYEPNLDMPEDQEGAKRQKKDGFERWNR